MTWVVWRQYRTGAAIAGAILAVFAAVMLVTGLRNANTWHSALIACKEGGSCYPALGSGLMKAVTTLTLAVPAVLGMFWGGPAVARERETGTVQFAWMQSVTRSRWLSGKVSWLLFLGAVFGGLVALLVTWWFGPLQAENQNQFTPGNFDILGIAPIGYAVFAVALGIAAGALFGRSLPAVALTAGVFVAVRVAFTFFVRQHLMPAVSAVFSVTQNVPATGATWMLRQGVILPDGRYTTALIATQNEIMNGPGGSAVPAACNGSMNQTLSCLARLGYRAYATYQPGYRFWPFQFIETGIFAALAAVLIGVTFFVVKRRDA